MKKTNKKGFTLVELLGVIALLGIVSTIAMTTVIPRIEESRKRKFVIAAELVLKTAEELFVEADYTNNRDSLGEEIRISGNGALKIDIDKLKPYIDNIEQNNYEGYVIISLADFNYGKSYIIMKNDKYHLRDESASCYPNPNNLRCAYSGNKLKIENVKKNDITYILADKPTLISN
ncbi:MAG: type II secretion system protein [Bacilli bacterium]|nr:type II secretion system protein [Bacilli bacterium]